MRIRSVVHFALVGALILLSCISLAATTGRIVVEPEAQWEFDSRSPIYGDSVVGGEHVYFANTNGVVYSLNKNSGAVAWQYQSGGAVYGGVSLGEGSVYFQSDDGYSYKLSSETGEVIWRVLTDPSPSRVALFGPNGWDYRSSIPIERNNQVYVGSASGEFYALDAMTGDVNWQFEADDKIRSAALVTETSIVFGTWGGWIYCLERETGELRWRYDTHDGTQRLYIINSSPTLHNDTIFIGSRNTNLYAIDINTGETKWIYPYHSSWVESQVSYYQGKIYAGSSFLRSQLAIEAEGGELSWRTSEAKGLSFTKIAVTDDSVYAGAVAVPGLFYTGFLVDAGLLKLDRLNGEAEWIFPIEPGEQLNEFGIVSSPVEENGTVYFGALNGKFYSIKEKVTEFPILNFSADRSELKAGEETTLRWEVVDNVDVYLNGRRVSNEGEQRITGSSDQTYTLSVSGRLTEQQTIEVLVKQASDINIAKFGEAWASTNENEKELPPSFVNDDDLTTRWSSGFFDGQVLMIDLKDQFVIGKVVLFWEGAYASSYHLAVSKDKSNWHTIYETTTNTGGTNRIEDLNAEGRYIKVVGDVRATPWGMSLFEMQVYEHESQNSP